MKCDCYPYDISAVKCLFHLHVTDYSDDKNFSVEDLLINYRVKSDDREHRVLDYLPEFGLEQFKKKIFLKYQIEENKSDRLLNYLFKREFPDFEIPTGPSDGLLRYLYKSLKRNGVPSILPEDVDLSD